MKSTEDITAILNTLIYSIDLFYQIIELFYIYFSKDERT